MEILYLNKHLFYFFNNHGIFSACCFVYFVKKYPHLLDIYNKDIQKIALYIQQFVQNKNSFFQTFFSHKFPLMHLKKVKIRPHIPKLRPALHVHRILIQVINLSSPHGQQERGMSSDDKLAAEEPGGVLQKAQ